LGAFGIAGGVGLTQRLPHRRFHVVGQLIDDVAQLVPWQRCTIAHSPNTPMRIGSQ
jgi:hypothetical protein